MEHYYSSTPSSAHAPAVIQARARGITVNLDTDAGVFSRRELDAGSRLLIETVSLPPDASVVDLGCGYGPVATILGAVFPNTTWLLLDVNERAVELASRNVRFMQNRAKVIQSDGFSAVPDIRADAVLLNPPIRAGKQVVYGLFESSYHHLSPGGSLWIVIHKKHGAPSAQKFLTELFSHVEVVDRKRGYHVMRAVTKS